MEYIRIAQYDTAMIYDNRAMDLARKLNFKKGMAEALYNMGLNYWYLYNYSEAFSHYLKGLKMYEELGDNKHTAFVLSRIALDIYMDADYMKCLEYYTRSLKLYEEINDKQNIAFVLSDMGWVYMNLSDAELIKIGMNPFEKYSKSLQCELQALNIYETINEKPGMAHAMENIGWIYLGLTDSACKKMDIVPIERYTKALEYEFKGLKLAREAGDRYIQTQIVSDIQDIYFKQGKYVYALKYADSTLKLAQENAYMDLEIYAHATCYHVYQALGNTSDALYHYEKYIALKDTLAKTRDIKGIAKEELQFKFGKKIMTDSIVYAEEQKVKDARIQGQKAQLKQEQTQRYSLYGGLTLVMIFSTVLFNRFRVIRSQKKTIEKQKTEVEDKNKSITDSINYAKRIQDSFLPSKDEMKKILPYEFFVLYQPKDIVSGDFYWVSSVTNNGSPLYVVAAADCTGHGVPGAFLSMMGNMLLNEIVMEKHITDPALILKEIHQGIFNSLHRASEFNDALDGMDIALCVIDPVNKIIRYAGAMNPLYLVRQDQESGEAQLELIKATVFSLGGKMLGRNTHQEVSFTNHEIPFVEGMRMYLFSDGYMDQVNKKQKIRMGSKKFKQLIAASSHLPVQEQKESLKKSFSDWKALDSQIDDVLVMGIKL